VEPLALRVDSQSIYWRDDFGQIFAAAKDGSGIHKVSGNANRSSVFGFDVNGSVVWWMWVATSSTTDPQGLFRANADGSGFTAVDTAVGDFKYQGGPLVDDTAIYYWHNFTLLKRLK
jgi:pantothenate kinase